MVRGSRVLGASLLLASEIVTASPRSPGWYNDPSDPKGMRYWNGTEWSAPNAPHAPPPGASTTNSKSAAVAAGVCVLAGVGLVMSMQSVSLMSGSGLVWMGVALVAGSVAVAFIMGAPKWARVGAALVLVLALSNGFYIENQMNKKRDEITHMFDK